MKFFWKMPHGLQPYYQQDLDLYRRFLKLNDLGQAWHHLERAHILGQPWAVEHTAVHWIMLKFGFRIKSWTEIRGQILRLVFGGIKSFVGKVPTGNTGGANVPPLLVMDLPVDLDALLAKYR